jgi:hypothetical protein
LLGVQVWLAQLRMQRVERQRRRDILRCARRDAGNRLQNRGLRGRRRRRARGNRNNRSAAPAGLAKRCRCLRWQRSRGGLRDSGASRSVRRGGKARDGSSGGGGGGGRRRSERRRRRTGCRRMRERQRGAHPRSLADSGKGHGREQKQRPTRRGSACARRADVRRRARLPAPCCGGAKRRARLREGDFGITSPVFGRMDFPGSPGLLSQRETGPVRGADGATALRGGRHGVRRPATLRTKARRPATAARTGQWWGGPRAVALIA